ncbi:hypothetical protein HRG_009247 [Hirsutella rhossiliensis]|uniref:Thiol methyltransferase n=1 Tax=Hirsutella rhossiliensis TaxID=111463 RepID=A0A9P8SFH9_9HYPO|nr:uncharacterized protein HRG_09247 [Hirsutella rhossiliensis]KAH0959465.1 hypothetical protein HRG_09247 [Hirsutella rhossiliensis]
MDAPVSSPMHSRNTSSAVSSTQQSPANVVVAAPPLPVQIKTPSTDALLKDFSLVAEAAKRAQVAVMVRDFESCGIS